MSDHFVAIIMGSDSDLPLLENTMRILKGLGIRYEARVASAHRTPDEVRKFVSSARANGFGVIIACAVLAVFAMVALPNGLAIYREAAVEYEVQCLLSDIRYMREVSRTTERWPKSMERRDAYQLPLRRQAQMRFRRGGYTMLAGSAVHSSHDFLPGIVITGRFATSSRDGIALTFGDDGLLATPCTMLIYMEGHPQSARKLILSAGGRCRVERSVK